MKNTVKLVGGESIVSYQGASAKLHGTLITLVDWDSHRKSVVFSLSRVQLPALNETYPDLRTPSYWNSRRLSRGAQQQQLLDHVVSALPAQLTRYVWI